MERVKIEVTLEQLYVIEQALEQFSRVGIGQFTTIKDHPTFEEHLHKHFALGKGKFEVGDKTVRGEVIEVDKKYKWIKTKGRWGGKEEIKKWTDLDKIQYSTDYEKYHNVRDKVDTMLAEARNELIQDWSVGKNGNWGIYNPNVHESCRVAFDLQQVFRHERWKQDEYRSSITVDAYTHLTTKNSNLIKCEL